MSEKVKMTVECLGQACGNCPELEIETERLQLTDGNGSWSVNNLYCAHLERCTRIYSMAKADGERNHVTQLKHSS